MLAVTSPNHLEGRRSRRFHLPGMGIDVDFSNWRGFSDLRICPRRRWNTGDSSALQDGGIKEWAAACDRYGWTVDYQGRDDFCKFWMKSTKRYAQLLDEIW